MTRQPYYFAVHLEEGVIGRAWLNDLPVHKVMTRGPDSMSGGASHMLVPGTNQLALEILALPAAPPPPPVAANGGPAEKRVVLLPAGFKVYRIKDASATPIVAEIVVNLDLPADLALKAGEPLEMPLYHTVTFTLPVPVAEPVYWRAPAVDVPCAGTPELVAAVTEVHDALAQLDLRRFLDLISLKHEAFAAAFAGDPVAALDRQRSASERFFGLRPLVKPLDRAKLHFEARAGGRVVHVSGWDDQPVLEAVAEDQPNLALRANLLLTQHDGHWRVFG